jgi:hypothetical protein
MGMPALGLTISGENSWKGVSYEEAIKAERTSVLEVSEPATLLMPVSDYCSQYFLLSIMAA